MHKTKAGESGCNRHGMEQPGWRDGDPTSFAFSQALNGTLPQHIHAGYQSLQGVGI